MSQLLMLLEKHAPSKAPSLGSDQPLLEKKKAIEGFNAAPGSLALGFHKKKEKAAIQCQPLTEQDQRLLCNGFLGLLIAESNEKSAITQEEHVLFSKNRLNIFENIFFIF